jgi:hypothetical protein
MKSMIGSLLKYSPFFAIFLAIVELILSNQFVGSGKTIRSTDIAIDMVRSENARLEQQVASFSSLMTVEIRAKALGFVETRQAQYVTLVPEQLPVAFNTTR